ncbi:uncharacterized protein LOC127867338 [Dreissena polymorpha]|uniref:BZIP domain-containing protein n=1 Tax=Dreissena polymorpha TaxID=45954 RepID=A0A9D4S3A9_DREPO|nr:uncharacterized protein LOC127867338 [Dreissena polymorpha]KAH3890984.1 hypothetical protein DPMN_015075 [Dreissena polymorpha]
MEGTTVCNYDVLRCLKDKISKSRNVEEIEQLIQKDKLPRTYEPSKEEIEKVKKRRACNRKSALQSRERQKKEYKENRKRLEELKEYNCDIKGKLKRMKNNKNQYITLLSAWMTEKEIRATLETKLQTESFDFLLSTDNSRDQCSRQSSTSGNELSTEDTGSVAALYEEGNDDGSSDGFDALSDRIECSIEEQQHVLAES